jgi:hypothetical protein
MPDTLHFETVATSNDEVKILHDLLKKGEINGVQNLKIMGKKELFDLEPHVNSNAIAALYAPDAGNVIPYVSFYRAQHVLLEYQCSPYSQLCLVERNLQLLWRKMLWIMGWNCAFVVKLQIFAVKMMDWNWQSIIGVRFTNLICFHHLKTSK